MFGENASVKRNLIITFSIFGFVLSIITGLIGRVFFGPMIGRAFLFALVFGGIGFLVIKIADIFLPELFRLDDETDNEEQDEDAEESDEEAGSESAVDITVEDEDNPDYVYSPDSGEAEASLEPEDQTGEDADDDVAELEDAGDDDAEASAESKPAKAAAPAAELSGSEKGKSTLPDIETFSDAFEQVTETETGDNGLSSIDGTGSGQAEILGSLHDTDEMVKAVKSVLKKDQEG